MHRGGRHLGLVLIVLAVAWPVRAGEAVRAKTDGAVTGQRREERMRVGTMYMTRTYDAQNRLEYTDLLVTDEEGNALRRERTQPDGRPWPYDFIVCGAPALGGLDKLAGDIRAIQAYSDTSGRRWRLDVIEFRSADVVEVRTRLGENFTCDKGESFQMKKINGRWVEPGNGRMRGGWKS